MSKVLNVAIGAGNVNMASANYTDAFDALDNLQVSIHEFSLTKTVCPEGRRSL